MRLSRRSLLAVAAAALCGVLAAVPQAAANDYSDPAYREHDLDNASRSSARQRGMFTSPEYGSAFVWSASESWLNAQTNQLRDLRTGRVHATLGQLLPGGAVGDPEAYHDREPIRIQFLARTGAKLSGRIWGADGDRPKPAVVITTGSIQGTEHMYWWAARALADAGYVVMTWDVQGQGESESTGHRFGDVTPTGDGMPSQQAANFYEGTIDALRFFFSTPAAGYRPLPRTEAEVAAAKATARANDEHLDWFNPAWGVVDRTRLGIAGHSLGAGAVSAVQQCSDQNTGTLPPLCQGTTFPIRAVIGWDSLNASGVTPVVPGMNQSADGYFLNPTPSPNAPSPTSSLGAYEAWKAAGLDTYSVSVRGGTHIEWTQIPYILPATAYGTKLASYYTLAWFDRYVQGDAAIAADADRRLRDGPAASGPNGETDVAWNAHHLSARRLSAFFLGGQEVRDLRSYAGLSRVGDWEGANADRVGREIP